VKKTLAVLAMAILSFCSAFTAVAADLEKSLAHDLTECSRIVRGLKTSGAISPEMLGRLKSIAETLKADRLLLAERQAAISQIAGPLGSKAPERQGKVSSELLTKLDELLTRLDALPAIPSAADLETLKALLKVLGTQKSRPLLGVLPYRHLGYPASEPATTPVVLPAYKGGDRTVVSADTAASPEAPVTKEIAELAQSLQWNPVLIYEWVKNNIQTEWYWGVMKGAEETLRQKSGNDADQAALLVALLRSGGFPARFVKGTVEFFPDVERAKNLTGLDDPARIAAFLQKAGIPYKAVIRGGGIANFQVEHIWVEAFIPYANYRGAVMDYQGKVWIGLDTSIKTKGYERVSGGGIPAAMLDTLREDYLAAPQPLTPLDYLTKKIDEQLAISQPGATWKDLQDRAAIIPDVLKILPAGLQFTQTALTGEYQTLPDVLKHTLVFTATANNNELLSYTIETHKLAGKRLALRYEPESTEDQNTINSFGGLDSTPPYLVRLRPVLTLDGERLVVGQDGLPMGESYTLQIDVVTPAGRERIISSQISGNLSVIAVAAQKAPAPAALSEKDDAELILHKEAIGYINRWDKSEDDLATLLGQAVSRPTVSLAVVGAQIETTTLLDVVHDFRWKGLFLDAAYRRIETVGRDGKERDFMRLSALQGSILENRIFEDDLKVDSISTAKLLQAAAAGGTAPLRIDKTTVSSILPTLPFDEAVISDIANAVNQGLVVTIPSTETTYFEWSGTGYIKEDPLTGESGWMLSGQVAGGMTSWGEERWDDPAVRMLASALMAPYSTPPNTDPAAAALIAKLSATDMQDGTAGQKVAAPLKVMVMDLSGRPVEGATVRFSVRAGGGSFDAGGTSQTTDVVSDRRGMAQTPYFLGKKNAANPISFKDSSMTYPVQVGENIVDAVIVLNGKGVVSPFSLYAFPGEPHHILNKTAQRIDLVFNYVGPAQIIVEDENNNPVANSPVTFQALNAYGFDTCYSLAEAKPALLIGSSNTCYSKIPYYGECGTPLTSISEKTDYFGAAAAGVMMGSIPGAHYDIKVDAVAIAAGGGRVPSVTVPYSTYAVGNPCGSSTNDPSVVLYTSYLYEVDTLGNNITAARSGSQVPLKARLYALRENATHQDVVKSCDGATCSKIIGNRTFTNTTDFVSSGVTFSTADSGNQAAQTAGQGLFTGSYTLKPGVNTITVKGSATIVRDRTEVCPDCSVVHQNLNLTAETTMKVFGVDISVPKTPLQVTTDANGYSLNDLVLSYTIAPAEYTAQIAHVLLFKDGQEFNYVTTEKSGQGSGSFLKGFKFEAGSSYDLQVVLNNGSGVEIRSDKVPVAVSGANVSVQRTHHQSAFDPAIPVLVTPYTDDFKKIPLTIYESATVKVAILNAAKQERAVLVPATALTAGSYFFNIDYEQIRSAGFNPLDPAYYIQVTSTYGSPAVDHIMLYPGQLSERSEGRMLGQTMVHDVLIQDGSLNLTRQDFSFTGRGPQLAFSRSYSNQTSPHGSMPLGNGWSHSLDLKLRVLRNLAGTAAGGLPDWVVPLKGKVYTPGDIPSTLDSPTMVVVNGNTFKKYNGTWYSERGRHGSLEETQNGYIFTSKDGTRYIYNSGLGDLPVSRIEDRNGNALVFSYNGQLLSKVTDAVGRKCDFSYGAVSGNSIGDSTRLTAVACSGDIELKFDYDVNGYLKSAKRGARAETYLYAQENGIAGGEYNLVKATDSNSNSFSYDYHAVNQLPANLSTFVKAFKSQDVIKSVTYPDGKQALFTYDVQTLNKRIVKDLRGNDTTYTLNYYGNPQKIEEPLGKTTLMTWSIDEGRLDNVMTSKTDPLGNLTRYEYDSKGNITKETDPYGNMVTSIWNAKFSLPESRTDRNGVQHTWQYDTKGNLLAEKDGDGKQTSHSYNSYGERESSSDPRGYTTRYSFDLWGNPASSTGAEGSLTRYEHDIRGRLTAQIDPNNHRTEYAFDELDQPTTVTLPPHGSYSLAGSSSSISTKSHDAVGNLKSETDHLGLTLTYSYTPRNQVKSITRSVGGTKDFEYDENGNLIKETDWKGNASSHLYDALNRRISSTNRLGHIRQMGYDLNGNLTSETDPEGRVVSHTYDKLNRLTKTVQPALDGQQAGELSYSYNKEADLKTNLKSETDQEGNTTSYEYNGRYLRIKRTNAQHGIDGANGIHLWAFDDSGNLVAETDEEGRVTSHEYDRQNRLTADIRTYRTGTGTSATSQTRYGYDPAGNRISVTDPLGNKTETVYDEWNRAWKTINPLGFTSISELDGAGNQTRTVDHRNNPRIWNRDQRGLVTGAIDAEGNETGYSYDENGNQTAITYANNSRTEISYDAEDRKGLITEAKGSPEERTSGVVQYDKVGNPLQVRDGNNNLTTTTYNNLNLPATVTDALGNSSSTSYYRTGKVKSSTNRRGAITTTDYDKLWRVIKVTDPLNQTISTSYDNVGNPRLATDKRGITSETIYDDLHRPVEKRRNNQRLASLEYDANNNLIAETDANNNRTIHAYDQLNRKISSTWPAVTGTGTTSSSQSLYGYDENNNLASETDEEGIITSHGYDRENRRTYTERAGEGTWHHFDKMGDLAAIVRPLGNTRSFEHDGLRRLTKATDDSWGLSLSTRYEYDKGGNLLKQIDPLGSTTENSFDKLNRKISTTWPAATTAGTGTSATSQSLYGYDSEGNLTAETDPKGQQISHNYDLLNRKTESRYPDTVISYSYDQNNNLLTANTSGSSISNSYDNFDRLQSSTQQGITVSYSYDLNGNRTSVATPGQSTGYSYDARNRVATATANSTTTSFDYYKDGKRKTISYPNTTTETWDYYPSNRVKTILTAKGGTTISQFDYSYDANGNRTSQIESGANRNKQTNYSFDSLDRMTGYSEDNGYQASYSYNGYNRATETETFYGGDRTSKTYSYDNANQLTTIETSQTDSGGNITSTSRIDYGYDLNGNTISRTVTDGTAGTGTSTTSQSLYSYDSRNKLITVSTDGSTLGQNSYNAQGYRIRQQQSDRGDIDYLYDGTSVIEERSNSSLLAHYRYAGKLLALSSPQGNQYYHLDALGSTTELTDDQGDIKASYHLDPWGSIEDTTGDSINRRIFTGKETDQNTGLINIGVRYYDPETARFITQDSYLGKQDEPPSLHRYLYAYSNPTVYVDLEGYAPVTSHVAKFLEGLSKDNKTELARMNARMNEKGLWGQLGSRTTAAFMGIGGSILDLAGGTAKLADIAADANIAASPLLRNTAIGKESRKRIADTTAAVVHTAKSAYKFAAATVEDPSGTAQVAKEKFGNYLEKTFIQGDLTYTADFSGKMFDVATALAPVRAAQMSKAAKAAEVAAIAEKAAIRERVLANIAEVKAGRKVSNFEIHSIIEKVPELDVSTAPNRAVVWSNAGGGNLTAADTFIGQNPGYLRLEMTPGGSYLEKLKLFERYPYDTAVQPWERLSAKFAREASGEVTAFTLGASPKSVFKRIELPIFTNENHNVTGIRDMLK